VRAARHAPCRAVSPRALSAVPADARDRHNGAPVRCAPAPPARSTARASPDALKFQPLKPPRRAPRRRPPPAAVARGPSGV